MVVLNILKCKCPNCEEGNVFEHKTGIIPFRIPKMKPRCELCDYKFEREPGFFFGAMFVSYALAVAEYITFFGVAHFLIGLPVLYAFFGIGILAVFGSGFNFRTSRLIWIYIFYKNPAVKQIHEHIE